jgi:hypothetical protein
LLTKSAATIDMITFKSLAENREVLQGILCVFDPLVPTKVLGYLIIALILLGSGARQAAAGQDKRAKALSPSDWKERREAKRSG